MKKWQVLKKGTFTGLNNRTVTVDDDVLNNIVKYAAENAEQREIPIVKGHPAVDSPKFGGIPLSSIVRENDAIYVTPSWLNNEVADQIVQKQYDACSLKFNPLTGRVFHLGILGAHAPAVSGLAPISLSDFDDKDSEEIVVLADSRMPIVAAIMRKLRDKYIEEKGVEQADQIFDSDSIAMLETYEPELPRWMSDAIDGLWEAVYSMQQKIENNIVKFSESQKMTHEQQLEQERSARIIAEGVAAEAKKRNRTLEIEAYLSQPDIAVRVTPSMKNEVVALLSSAMDSDETVEFADTDGIKKKPIAESLKNLISLLPVAVMLGGSLDADAVRTDGDNEEAARMANMVNRK